MSYFKSNGKIYSDVGLKEIGESINLYWIYMDGDTDADYGYFVFAKTRNRAKALCVHRCTDYEEYVDFRSRLLGKNIGKTELVVESPNDEDYIFVQQCGFEFQEQEE